MESCGPLRALFGSEPPDFGNTHPGGMRLQRNPGQDALVGRRRWWQTLESLGSLRAFPLQDRCRCRRDGGNVMVCGVGESGSWDRCPASGSHAHQVSAAPNIREDGRDQRRGTRHATGRAAHTNPVPPLHHQQTPRPSDWGYPPIGSRVGAPQGSGVRRRRHSAMITARVRRGEAWALPARACLQVRQGRLRAGETRVWMLVGPPSLRGWAQL